METDSVENNLQFGETGQKTKVCKMCLNEYPEKEFYPNGHSGLSSQCKTCEKKRCSINHKAWRIKNPIKQWCHNTFYHHKYNGFAMQIKIDDLLSFVIDTPRCQMCGCELNWDVGKKVTCPDSPTLDRIDNENEIRLDNIQIVCHSCNRTKGGRSMKQLLEYCNHIVEKHTE